MKRKTLKTALYRLFINSVLIPFVLISMVVFGIYYLQTLETYKNNNKITLQSISNHLEGNLKDAERFFYQYLFDDNISNFYKFLNLKDYDDSNENMHEYYQYSSDYKRTLNKYLTTYNDYHQGYGFIPEYQNENTIFYLSKFGTEIISYENMDMVEESWYQDMINLSLGETLFMAESIMNGSAEYNSTHDTFIMIRQSNNLELAKKQGYVFFEISKNVFSDMFKNFSFPEESSLIVYYPNGTVAHIEGDASVEEVLIDDLITKEYGELVSLDHNNYYVFNSEVESFGFAVCYLLPQDVIMNQVYSSSIMVIGVWLIFILISIVIYWRLSGKVSLSARKIVEKINAYRMKNEEETRLDPEEMVIKEFVDISQALVDMQDRITHLVKHEYIMKLEQQMAEYKAMQAEINPHFFYNVMISLQALNRLGDKDKLENGIVDLSKMFRYTCEHSYDSSIIQECDFIQSYLMLEKLRHEERFDFQIHVEEELEDFPIPKLLLQPIVENAMRHGLPDTGEYMEIRLNVTSVKREHNQKFVWISIANDGVPFTNKIYESTGVGITNVKERLSIKYPNSFFWYSREGRFQTVCNILILIDEENL